jgi:hypothetical protein
MVLNCIQISLASTFKNRNCLADSASSETDNGLREYLQYRVHIRSYISQIETTNRLDRNGIPEPPYALVVCEKPSVALRIAQALGTSSFAKITGVDKELGPVEKRRSRFQSIETEVYIQFLMLTGCRF